LREIETRTVVTRRIETAVYNTWAEAALQELVVWTVLLQWNNLNVFVYNHTKSTKRSLIIPTSIL